MTISYKIFRRLLLTFLHKHFKMKAQIALFLQTSLALSSEVSKVHSNQRIDARDLLLFTLRFSASSPRTSQLLSEKFPSPRAKPNTFEFVAGRKQRRVGIGNANVFALEDAKANKAEENESLSVESEAGWGWRRRAGSAAALFAPRTNFSSV
jgi:hypothetical protein